MKNLITILCFCLFWFSCGKQELKEGEFRIEKKIEKTYNRHIISKYVDGTMDINEDWEQYIDIEIVYKYDHNDNIVEMSKYSPNGELCRRCSRDHGDYYHIIRKYDSNNNVIYFRGSDSCGNEESFNKYDSKNNMIESISTNDTRWGVKYTYEYDLLDSLIKVSKFHNNNIDTNDDWEEVIYD